MANKTNRTGKHAPKARQNARRGPMPQKQASVRQNAPQVASSACLSDHEKHLAAHLAIGAALRRRHPWRSFAYRSRLLARRKPASCDVCGLLVYDDESALDPYKCCRKAWAGGGLDATNCYHLGYERAVTALASFRAQIAAVLDTADTAAWIAVFNAMWPYDNGDWRRGPALEDEVRAGRDLATLAHTLRALAAQPVKK